MTIKTRIDKLENSFPEELPTPMLSYIEKIGEKYYNRERKEVNYPDDYKNGIPLLIIGNRE